jgi:FkbM family methyltransferase
MNLRTWLSQIIAATPLGYFPVRVRSGPAKGAKWTLAPFSHNWRCGGENIIEPALSLLPNRNGRVCWDFGAHFGIHTVGMAMQVGSAGEVVSFEPDPIAFLRLKYHVKINRLNNVRLYQAAASKMSGRLRLITDRALGSSSSHFQYEDEPMSEQTPTEEVEAVSADELVCRGEIRSPDLIKVDVEGHGAKALEGSVRSILEKWPIIIFSNHSPWELEGVRKLLEPFYSVFSLQGTPISWEAWNAESRLLVPSRHF